MARPISLPSWPDGCQVSVSLTFDFDADVGPRWSENRDRLTAVSEDRYGAARGIWRILDLLRERNLRCTFFVPGEIVERYPEEVGAIVAEGHEIGHHGHLHLFNDRIDEATAREEVVRGKAAIEDGIGRAPIGYRAPGWEVTPHVLRLLAEEGFLYDSSCMGDDRPYWEEADGVSMLEMPVHWSLNDWGYFGYGRDTGGYLADPRAFVQVFLEEFESALAERRHVTYTIHPSGAGRGYRARALAELIDRMAERADVWFAPLEAVADRVLAPAADRG